MLFNDGNRLMKEGKLMQACAAFEASNRAESGAGTLILLGQCREKTRQLASAWFAYKQAGDRAKDARKRAYAMARVAELQPQLSYLTVSVPDANRVDGMTIERGARTIDRALWNLPQPIDGGDHVITVHAPGREAWKTAVHVAIARDKIRIEVPRLQDRSPASAALPPPGPTQPPPAADEPPGTFTPMRKIAVGAAGASAISLIVGVVLGASSNARQDDAFRLCPEPATPCSQAAQSNALIRSSHDRAHEANVAFGIAGGVAFVATALWFAGAPDTERTARISVVPSLLLGEPGIAAMGRF